MDGVFAIVGFLGTPFPVVLGWMRWWKNPPAHSFFAGCSLVSQGISTLVIVFSYPYILYEFRTDPARPEDFLSLTLVVGWVLPVAAVLLACLGVWRKHALRFFALLSSIGAAGIYLFAFLLSQNAYQ